MLLSNFVEQLLPFASVNTPIDSLLEFFDVKSPVEFKYIPTVPDHWYPKASTVRALLPWTDPSAERIRENVEQRSFLSG